jgi:hypothetical protein
MEDPTDIDSLVSQLQGINKIAKNQNAIQEQIPITKDNLETFIIDQASKLIQDTNFTIQTIKPMVEAAPDAKEVSALAELIQASTSTLDTLSKLVISDKKNTTLKDIKKMDVEKKSARDETHKLRYSREEIFKQLFSNEPTEVDEIKL